MKEKRRQVKKPSFHYDTPLIIIVFLLLSMGLLMVGSASMVISDKLYGFAFYYLIRQVVFVVVGCLAAWFITRVPLRLWEKYSRYLFLFSMVLLFLVLIPGIGRVVNGSRRWIHLGVLSLQISEFVKLTAVLYLASYLARFRNQVQEDIIGFIKPLLVLMAIALLLLLEPDFGGTTVITVTFLAMLFVAGARLLPFCVMFFGVVLAMAGLAVASPYRLIRLTTFLNPWHHAFGSGYQLTQSLIAFGRGGVLGVGLGNSVQKLFYLPEAHSDFVFAVLGEELGLLGELFLLALFFALIVRLLVIAKRAYDKKNVFAEYVCYGVTFWLGSQALINMGVNVGMLPTKGLTLPFISYGGSSLMVTCITVGLIMRIAYEVTLQSGSSSYVSYRKQRGRL